jgi:hypothetical protein
VATFDEPRANHCRPMLDKVCKNNSRPSEYYTAISWFRNAPQTQTFENGCTRHDVAFPFARLRRTPLRNGPRIDKIT